MPILSPTRKIFSMLEKATEKQKFNFSRIVPFYIKSKGFIHYCSLIDWLTTESQNFKVKSICAFVLMSLQENKFLLWSLPNHIPLIIKVLSAIK